jgi:general secretion pathway protein D
MRATKVETIVTDYSYGSASGGLGGGTGGTASSSGTVINTAAATTVVQPVTTPMEIGPTLDVVPYVLSDDYTINMTIIPELLEFNGYDTPTLPPITGIANVQIIPAVLPDFTVRSVVTTVNVWDNQTVVLGGLISSTIQTTKDKVPFLGDLPLVGRLFQSQSKSTKKQNLMIFVTATIVDPAGNRMHSDDELPFNPAMIPAQPAVSANGIGQTTIQQPANSPLGAVVVTPVK